MICILLSTHNGARFLPRQLASLRRQTRSDWRLLIRDDASSDNTLEMLRDFIAREPRARLLEAGDRMGVAGSYLRLLSLAETAQYYAFCDQDDLWDEDKLARAVQTLERDGSGPALYCSRLRLVDEQLKPLGLSRLYRRGPAYANALVQNIVTGCSMVLNRAAVDLLRRRPPAPERIVMHDWWCYLVVAAFGKVFFDPLPSITYRQHDSNTIGEFSGLSYWTQRFRRFQSHRKQHPLPTQLAEFDRCWGAELAVEKKQLLRRLNGIFGETRSCRRFGSLLRLPVWRQTGVDTLLLKILIMFRGIA